MRNIKSIITVSISYIAICLVCLGVIFLFQSKTNNDGLKNKLSYDDNEEINLGDACSTCVNLCKRSGHDSDYCNRDCAGSCSTATTKPTNTPAPVCTVSEMKTASKCKAAAKEACSYGYTGCSSKSTTTGCYSYTCKPKPTNTPKPTTAQKICCCNQSETTCYTQTGSCSSSYHQVSSSLCNSSTPKPTAKTTPKPTAKITPTPSCGAGQILKDGKCTKCTITSISLPQEVSAGYSSSGSVTSDCKNLSVSQPKNAAVTLSGKSLTIKPAKACVEVSFVISDGKVSKKATISKNNVKTKWHKMCTNCKAVSGMADSKAEADSGGKDYYGVGCSTTKVDDKNVKMCKEIWSRSACGGSSTTYNYCCVKNDNSDYRWKTNQTNQNCPDGYKRDTSITNSAVCKNPACYKRTSGSKKGELVWTNDSTVGTFYSKESKLCKNCYMDQSTWEKSTSAIYTYANKVTTRHNVYINKKESECKKVPSATFCNPINTNVEKKEKEASKCESSVPIEYQDGKSCNGDAYYNIICTNTITATFDNNDDSSSGNLVGTTNTVVPGQGFSFGINLQVVRTCKGTFDGTKWTNDYNRLKDGLQFLTNESDIRTVKNTMKELEGFVKDYNSYDNSSISGIGGEFSMTYKTEGSNKKLSTNFTSTTIKNGSGKFTSEKTVKLGVSGLTNPKTYTWTNESDPKILKLYFPISYIDSSTGEITSSNEGINGGNKLYISNDALGGTSTMSIKIYSPNSTNSIATIKNEKCKLKIINPEIEYRPIDLSNPFINSSYRKGENWLNELFDFTRAIRSDTWSGDPLYVVKLSPTNISDLKSNNSYYLKNGYSPYYGLCKVLKASEIKKDLVAKKLCDDLDVDYSNN